jgi:hypothetical protein
MEVAHKPHLAGATAIAGPKHSSSTNIASILNLPTIDRPVASITLFLKTRADKVLVQACPPALALTSSLIPRILSLSTPLIVPTSQ